MSAPITPLQLSTRIQEVICEESGICILWEQHEGPLLPHEAERLEHRIRNLMLDVVAASYRQKQEHYSRAAAGR